MAFQIQALQADQFTHLFEMSESELAALGGKRVIADEAPGYPCRVSLEDAEIGDVMILLNYEHLPSTGPYASKHAIFVRQNVKTAKPGKDEVPDVLSTRLLSIRAFDAQTQMIEADVIEGRKLQARLLALFEQTDIHFVDIHNAMQGCFAARAVKG